MSPKNPSPVKRRHRYHPVTGQTHADVSSSESDNVVIVEQTEPFVPDKHIHGHRVLNETKNNDYYNVPSIHKVNHVHVFRI